MKTKYISNLAVILAGFFLLCCPNIAAAINTNDIGEQFKLSDFGKIGIDMNGVDEDVVPLPFIDRMDFDSIEYFNPTRFGRDFFSFRFAKLGKRTDFGAYIVSEYPLSVVGPNRDILGIGFSIVWKPRWW